MTGRDDAAYRLSVATTLLRKAREAAARSEWRESALFARNAIENAAKAVLACFGAVPRSHEPATILEEALRDAAFPAAHRAEGTALATRCAPYGMAEHVLLSYGDEKNHVDPWSLVTESHAADAVAVAADAVDFASRVSRTIFP